MFLTPSVMDGPWYRRRWPISQPHAYDCTRHTSYRVPELTQLVTLGNNPLIRQGFSIEGVMKENGKLIVIRRAFIANGGIAVC